MLFFSIIIIHFYYCYYYYFLSSLFIIIIIIFVFDPSTTHHQTHQVTRVDSNWLQGKYQENVGLFPETYVRVLTGNLRRASSISLWCFLCCVCVSWGCVLFRGVCMCGLVSVSSCEIRVVVGVRIWVKNMLIIMKKGFKYCFRVFWWAVIVNVWKY